MGCKSLVFETISSNALRTFIEYFEFIPKILDYTSKVDQGECHIFLCGPFLNHRFARASSCYNVVGFYLGIQCCGV